MNKFHPFDVQIIQKWWIYSSYSDHFQRLGKISEPLPVFNALITLLSWFRNSLVLHRALPSIIRVRWKFSGPNWVSRENGCFCCAVITAGVSPVMFLRNDAFRWYICGVVTPKMALKQIFESATGASKFWTRTICLEWVLEMMLRGRFVQILKSSAKLCRIRALTVRNIERDGKHKRKSGTSFHERIILYII